MQGKVALIAGGGGGLGRAVADDFAQAGMHLVLLDRNEELLAKTVADLTAATGEEPLAVPIDVMLMMLPPSPCVFIWLAARCVVCNNQPKFMRITASHPRTLVSTKSALNVPPATFTNVSSFPKRASPSVNA